MKLFFMSVAGRLITKAFATTRAYERLGFCMCVVVRVTLTLLAKSSFTKFALERPFVLAPVGIRMTVQITPAIEALGAHTAHVGSLGISGRHFDCLWEKNLELWLGLG